MALELINLHERKRSKCDERECEINSADEWRAGREGVLPAFLFSACYGILPSRFRTSAEVLAVFAFRIPRTVPTFVSDGETKRSEMPFGPTDGLT